MRSRSGVPHERRARMFGCSEAQGYQPALGSERQERRRLVQHFCDERQLREPLPDLAMPRRIRDREQQHVTDIGCAAAQAADRADRIDGESGATCFAHRRGGEEVSAAQWSADGGQCGD